MTLSEPIRQLARSGDVRGDTSGAANCVEPSVMEAANV